MFDTVYLSVNCMLGNNRSLVINRHVRETVTEYYSCCGINRLEIENNNINLYVNVYHCNPISIQINSASSFNMSTQKHAIEAIVIVSFLKYSGWREIVIFHDNTTGK